MRISVEQNSYGGIVRTVFHHGVLILVRTLFPLRTFCLSGRGSCAYSFGPKAWYCFTYSLRPMVWLFYAPLLTKDLRNYGRCRLLRTVFVQTRTYSTCRPLSTVSDQRRTYSTCRPPSKHFDQSRTYSTCRPLSKHFDQSQRTYSACRLLSAVFDQGRTYTTCRPYLQFLTKHVNIVHVGPYAFLFVLFLFVCQTRTYSLMLASTYILLLLPNSYVWYV